MKKRFNLFGVLFLLTACGPSQQEINEIAQLSCNLMANSKNMDAAYRIEKINEARSEIGGKRFLASDKKFESHWNMASVGVE